MATALRIEYEGSLRHVIAEVMMAERCKSYLSRQLNEHEASTFKRTKLLLLILTSCIILIEYQLHQLGVVSTVFIICIIYH